MRGAIANADLPRRQPQLKTVLFLAYYYPPCGSMGSHRAIKFAKYLGEFGWHPVVITPSGGHDYLGASLDDGVEQGIEVIRTANFNVSSALKQVTRVQTGADSLIAAPIIGSNAKTRKGPHRRGAVLRALKTFLRSWVYVPDGQIGWYPSAVGSCRKLLAERRIDCILSTSFPITAHLIARRLKHTTGIPWVADFRDPWTESAHLSYSSRLRKRLDQQIERSILTGCDAVVTVSGGLARDFSRLSGDSARVEVIRNGFDSSEFERLDYSKPDKWTITYLATVTSSGDPSPFLKVLVRLINAGKVKRTDVRFRIVGDPAPFVRELIVGFGVGDLTEFTGFVTHRDALELQVNSSLLLLCLYGPGEYPGCISGKLYEHVGARRPILALTYPDYEAAEIIQETGAGTVAEPDDHRSIEDCLITSYAEFKSGQQPRGSCGDLSAFDRRAGAGQLAALMSELVSGRISAPQTA